MGAEGDTYNLVAYRCPLVRLKILVVGDEDRI